MGGDLTLNGALSLGNQLGGDLQLGGDWTNTGAFHPNGRGVELNGMAPQTLRGATAFET